MSIINITVLQIIFGCKFNDIKENYFLTLNKNVFKTGQEGLEVVALKSYFLDNNSLSKKNVL